MQRISEVMIVVLLTAAGVSAQAPAAPAGQADRGGRAGAPATPPMVLSTPAFSDGAVIPNRHTQVQQAERGISPQLVWTNAPPATQSFVVHMRDPEVARNRTTDDQVHWLVWNIAGTEKGLPEGMPEGAQLPNGMRQISASGSSWIFVLRPVLQFNPYSSTKSFALGLRRSHEVQCAASDCSVVGSFHVRRRGCARAGCWCDRGDRH